MKGFCIKVCGEAICGDYESQSADLTQISERKYAMAKEVAIPRGDDLPLPIFLLD